MSVEANLAVEEQVQSTKTQGAKKRTRGRKKSDKDSVSESCKTKLFHGPHKTNMLAQLNRDRTADENYCDVTVQVDGHEYPAHKCVLGKLSLFFHKMFKVEMQERYGSVASIYGVGNEVMKTILDFMYTGTIKLTENNVMEILVTSDYLQMDNLKRFCVEFLSEAMNKSNCLDIQRSGQLFNIPALCDAAETMTARNFADIIEQTQFQELDKASVVKFLSSRDQKAFGSKEVYEGVLSWVYFDLENRKENFAELFQLVKLHLLPASYLEEIVANQDLVKESHECKDYFQKELLYRLKLPSSVRTPNEPTEPAVSSSVEANAESLRKVSEEKDEVTCKPHPEATPLDSASLPKQNAPKKKNKPKTTAKPSSGTKSPSSVPANSEMPSSDIPGPSHSSNSSPASHQSDFFFSKELARILRHGKYSDIAIDSDGYAVCNHILRNPRFKQQFGNRTVKDMRRVAHSGDKKRFELKQFNTIWKIRATGKHTIKIDKPNGNPQDDSCFFEQRRLSNISVSSNSSTSNYPGDAEVSKELVKILRHGIYRDVKVDSSGFVSVQKILNHPRFRKFCGNISFDDLEYIVETNEKKYFEMIQVGSEWKIKALHGHTVQVEELELAPLTEDNSWTRFVHHRTSRKAWENIKTSGLNRMKRNHIHFYMGIPTADEISKDKKANQDIAVVVDFVQASQAGLKFFLTSNNTVLCPGNNSGNIPNTLFTHVIQLRPKWERIL